MAPWEPRPTVENMSQPTSLGGLREHGYRSRSVKEEIRENLLAAAARRGAPAFPGIVGFDDTVLPQLESALLAGHDLVLLGERGQGKTRLMRTLAHAARRVDAGRRGLRDQRRPRRAGVLPLPAAGRGASATTCRWRGCTATQRYVEKLATPDTSVGDLVGDVDPVKVAEGRTLG